MESIPVGRGCAKARPRAKCIEAERHTTGVARKPRLSAYASSDFPESMVGTSIDWTNYVLGCTNRFNHGLAGIAQIPRRLRGIHTSGDIRRNRRFNHFAVRRNTEPIA